MYFCVGRNKGEGFFKKLFCYEQKDWNRIYCARNSVKSEFRLDLTRYLTEIQTKTVKNLTVFRNNQAISGKLSG